MSLMNTDVRNYISGLILTATLTWLLPNSAHCQDQVEVLGQVRNSGGPSQRKTSINAKKNDSPVNLCEGGKRFSIAQLPGSIVSIKGRWMTQTKESPKCFFADNYEILEVASGRPAIVGELKLIEKNSYAILGRDGRSWRLSSLAPGLKGLVDSAVVSDLIADRATDTETTWLVVRMFSKPD